jgi:hypothetical protein
VDKVYLPKLYELKSIADKEEVTAIQEYVLDYRKNSNQTKNYILNFK